MPSDAAQHNENGRKCYLKKKYEDAIEHYTKAINLNPIVKYYQNRAMCHFQLSNLKHAENDCRRALELSPNEVKPLYFLGMIFTRTKRHSEAIACLSKALYHNSDITNTAEIENMLRRARHEKFEEEESRKNVQEVEFFSYVESLIESDRAKSSSDQSALQKCDNAKKRLAEIVNISAERRQRKAVPEVLCGKITLELMKDPVIVPSGITYDREEIVQHLRRIGHFDPVTRNPLTENDIIPNYALKEVIEKFLDENPWAKYDPSCGE